MLQAGSTFAHRLAADTPTLDVAVGTYLAMLTQPQAVGQHLQSKHKLNHVISQMPGSNHKVHRQAESLSDVITQ